ncbi:high frequency lysogenization protein [Natronospira proteinivora]|uniref:High frequency lysogenization protein HflD homolog n=1 Tax=Natronospira proteinivora TaxID=1807133 RepID=A0ABT1G908_9GAMM|nr:high frequency lysogenization protein HflD [Natronospira proteinivora]MCP1726788.1 high frequency lysogenization protein [Natronospira proteinivora]
MSQLSDRVIALAALFQAVTGVHQLARNGQADKDILHAAVKSTLTRDAESTEAIFGGVQALLPGLRQFHRLLTEQVPADDMALTRYAVGVMHIAKKLRKKPALMDALSSGIDKAERSVSHFGSDHENVFAALADTYSETAGNIHPRIMVSGNDNHLQNPRVVNQIRSLLLAAIRAAVLWHQLGGNRFSLIFRRKALAQEALRLTRQT